MSYRARSDDDKAQLGLRQDYRHTDEARALRTLNKVHAFPTLREIPVAAMPLGEAGQATYDKWARILFDAGRLTQLTKQWIENLAIAEDSIARLTKEGKIVPASFITQRSRALLAIEPLNVDPSLTPKKSEGNEFAHNGFPARLHRR